MHIQSIHRAPEAANILAYAKESRDLEEYFAEAPRTSCIPSPIRLMPLAVSIAILVCRCSRPLRWARM